MKIFGKLCAILSCIIGIVCCILPLLEQREALQKTTKLPEEIKIFVACTSVGIFVSAMVAIAMLVTICCPCSKTIAGFGTAVAGCGMLILMVVAYSGFLKARNWQDSSRPKVSEWLFGGIINAISTILIATTLVFD